MFKAKKSSEASPLLASLPSTINYLKAPNTLLPDDVESHGNPICNGPPGESEDENEHGQEDTSTPNHYDGLPEVKKRLKWIMPAVSLGVFLSACDQTVIASSYGSIGSDLGSLNNMSWVATSYLMSMTCFQPLYGKLSDIFGRKSVLLVSYAMLGTGCLLCGLAQNLSQLIAARAITGIGGAGNTLVTILLSDIVPMRERGTWQGMINLVFASGASLGAPLGGIIADRSSWRWTFLGQAPLCALTFILVYLTLHLPEKVEGDWRSKIRRVDFFGATSLMAAIFFLLLGLDRGSNVSFTAPIALVSTALYQPFIAIFFWIERKYTVEPIAPMRIILDRSLLASYLCNFFSLAGWFGAVFYIPLFYQAVDGLSAFDAGIRLLPGIIAAVVGSLASGFIIQKTGKYYWLGISGYAQMVLGSLCILLFTGLIANNDYGIWTGLVLGGLGNGIGLTTSLLALISNASQADQASVTACSYLFRSLGTVIGLASISTVIQSTLRIQLFKTLPPAENVDDIVRAVRESLDFINDLSEWEQAVVRTAYGVAMRNAFGVVLTCMVGALSCSWFVREAKLSR